MGVRIRTVREDELGRVGHIFRIAFGTFLGVPDPSAFAADCDFVRTRWRRDPQAVLGAELDGQLVGTNFVQHWGSVGYFGPLTVLPDYWERKIAQRLLEPTMELFRSWGVRHSGLYTFANSPKHLALYQKFGFWPRFLTLSVEKEVDGAGRAAGVAFYSKLPPHCREECLEAARDLTGSIYEGLDLAGDIRAVEEEALGDTVLIEGSAGLVGFAVCHCGAGTEAGIGNCAVKFGAVRPGPNAGDTFERLLDGCLALAAHRGLSKVLADISAARHNAYRRMLDRGFRIYHQGVTMHNPNEAAYHTPDVYVTEVWR